MTRLVGVGLAVASLFLAMTLGASDARAESNLYGNINLKFGPYYPNVDEELGDATPFEDSFGNNRRLMSQLSGEYYLFERHGKLGVGGSFGFTRFRGSSEVAGDSNGGDNGTNGTNGSTDGSDDLSVDEETKMQIFPLGLHLSYRWDYLVHELNIPLAPKVEAGLDYYLWQTKDGGGNTSDFGGDKGRGGQPGYHLTGRIELLLDIIDPQGAAAFDVSWGINNSYLFAEYTYSRIRGFNGEGLQLGDSTWNIGLAFEF